MKLGIIGSGNIGKSIGAWAANLGYEVYFAAKHEAHAAVAAQFAGHGAESGPVRTVAQAADLILLAVPYDQAANVLKDIAGLLNGKTVIDVTNPLSADFNSLTVGLTSSAAEEIAKLVPEARVVKAFNMVFADIYKHQDPQIMEKTLSIFYAGDDPQAKALVRQLIDKMGFEPVDSGPLKSARWIEATAMLNITLAYRQGYGTRIGLSLARKG